MTRKDDLLKRSRLDEMGCELLFSDMPHLLHTLPFAKIGQRR